VGGGSRGVGFEAARVPVGEDRNAGCAVLWLDTACLASFVGLAERRGGGMFGFGFGFSSWVSGADTKDDADDGA
jgi:hypothetical protein